MKVFLLITSLVFLCSCGSTSIDKPHQIKSDTARTLLFYLDNSFKAKVDVSFRIIKDTFKFDTINAETAKRVWMKDTSYYVPVVKELKDSTGKVILDSTGKPKQSIEFQLLQNKVLILQDFNKQL